MPSVGGQRVSVMIMRIACYSHEGSNKKKVKRLWTKQQQLVFFMLARTISESGTVGGRTLALQDLRVPHCGSYSEVNMRTPVPKPRAAHLECMGVETQSSVGRHRKYSLISK